MLKQQTTAEYSWGKICIVLAIALFNGITQRVLGKQMSA